jgi:hypothetical protein
MNHPTILLYMLSDVDSAVKDDPHSQAWILHEDCGCTSHTSQHRLTLQPLIEFFALEIQTGYQIQKIVIIIWIQSNESEQ